MATQLATTKMMIVLTLLFIQHSNTAALEGNHQIDQPMAKDLVNAKGKEIVKSVMFSFLAAFLIFTLFKINDQSSARGLRRKNVTLFKINDQSSSRGPRRKFKRNNGEVASRGPMNIVAQAQAMVGVPPIIQHEQWHHVTIVHACRGNAGQRKAIELKDWLSWSVVGRFTICNAYFLNLEEAIFKISGNTREGGRIVHFSYRGRDHTFNFLNDDTLIDVIEHAVYHQTTVAHIWEGRGLDAALFRETYGFGI